MAQHRLLSESWLLLPKILEEFACWEKVGLVLYIKDIWRMARFANIFSSCFNFAPYNFGYTFIKKYREHSHDLLIGCLTHLFFILNWSLSSSMSLL
jgi:hypothetical protein